MKLFTNIFNLIAALIYSSLNLQNESFQGKDFTSKVDLNTLNENAVQYPFFDREKNPLQPRFEMLSIGQVKPKGWLYDLMKEDITTGFVA